jgi:nitroimidazol reductase NimA-like FMN-containing flavoprotein (pyridoxamine 5'-phosphate oxidase superfamily)
MTEKDFQSTPRTRLKRKPKRAAYDAKTVHAIIDAGLICHVGYVIDGQPYVTPTAHWRDGGRIYWHGSSASRMLRAQKAGIPVCLTVSHLDGLVLARSGFHHSLNYRAVMLFGSAEFVEGDEAKNTVLKAFMDRIMPGRWRELRPPTKQELKGTTILGMELAEVSAKVRTGGVIDEEEDYDWDVWAGVVPIHTHIGEPEDDDRLKPGTPRPDYLARFRLG